MTKRKASIAHETENESDQSNSTQDNNSNSTSATTGTASNIQANHNGIPSTASGNGQQSSVDGTNSGNQKNKKERADNWSNAEIQVLHRGIESRRDIFYGPPSQATKKNRELAWDEITKEVNSVSTTPRSLSQVMKKFKNEKCRAKRKYMDADKEGHNANNMNNTSVKSSSNNNNTTNSNANANLGAQNHTNNQQQQQQQQQQQLQSQQPHAHHMTTSEAISSQQSFNVVKLAPQNVAKTMIDLPGHVQQIQMPNDDMVLIVPPEMDGLLSGVNLVSDGNGHHHLQKCSGNGTLNNQQHGHHGHPTLQALNGQGLVNGTMGNGMMARTIPAGSMCSLVYSTGGEVCGTDQHLTNSVANTNQIPTNHLGVSQQTLMHHRGSVDQNQGQPQQQQQPQPHQPQPQHHHHQLHQPQQTHQQLHQPQQLPHQPSQHHQHHLQPNQLATSSVTSAGGVAVESQLKNLLFNLLLKEGGQPSSALVDSNQEIGKQHNEILKVIANSLTKIESHLCDISKVASSVFAQTSNSSSRNASGITATSVSLSASNSSLGIGNNDGNNNNVNISGPVSANTLQNSQSGNET